MTNQTNPADGEHRDEYREPDPWLQHRRRAFRGFDVGVSEDDAAGPERCACRCVDCRTTIAELRRLLGWQQQHMTSQAINQRFLDVQQHRDDLEWRIVELERELRDVRDDWKHCCAAERAAIAVPDQQGVIHSEQCKAVGDPMRCYCGLKEK